MSHAERKIVENALKHELSPPLQWHTGEISLTTDNGQKGYIKKKRVEVRGVNRPQPVNPYLTAPASSRMLFRPMGRPYLGGLRSVPRYTRKWSQSDRMYRFLTVPHEKIAKNNQTRGGGRGGGESNPPIQALGIMFDDNDATDVAVFVGVAV